MDKETFTIKVKKVESVTTVHDVIVEAESYDDALVLAKYEYLPYVPDPVRSVEIMAIDEQDNRLGGANGTD